VTILVVEADPLRRRWIEHALSGGGYDVKTVSSAKQGLKCLKRIRFDVVVIGGHLRAIDLPSGSLRLSGYIPNFQSS
jgi:CheY-like chemotaxis protein